MTNVVYIRSTYAPVPPNNVLDGARDQLSEVLVIGQAIDGELYVACSTADIGATLLLLELAKAEVMQRTENSGNAA